MKVASWNVNSLKVRLPQVLQWLDDSSADILALQETKLTDDNFPLAEIEAAGYTAIFAGQKTYNGVAIISKQAAQDVVSDIPDLDDPQRRILAASYGELRVINLYVVNGQEVGSDKYAHKLHWLAKVSDYIESQLKTYQQLIVLGDFNIAPEDRDVYNPKSWHERILCSTPERQALQTLLDLGLQDTFRLHEQAEGLYSWWDYRAAGFQRNNGLRIDLILASEALAQCCYAASIDKVPRGWERPSDHTPVIAEFR